MKWIGKHIFDLNSRFKSDTVFEGDVEVAAGKGITGNVTGNVSGTAATVTAAAQPNIESIGTDGDTLAILADDVNLSSGAVLKPFITLLNTRDDAYGGGLILKKLRDDNGVATGTQLGGVSFQGEDSAQNAQYYAFINSTIDVSTHGQESGKLHLGVANHDGELGDGLTMVGGDENDEIDVTVGLGANSVVTIPGQLLAHNGGMGTRHYGTTIKILPSDFITNIDGGNTKHGVGFSDTAGATDYGIKIPNTAVELHAFVSIPEGMKATHVTVYDKNNVAFEVFEVKINATTITSKGSGNCNATLTLSAEVSSTVVNMLDIKVTTTSVNDRVYGGYVTIAAI
jgi:hypothetical protein